MPVIVGKDVVKKPRITLRRVAITLVVIVLLYTLGGFFGVPLIAKHVVLPHMSEKGWLNGAVTAEKVRFNPYTLRLELDDLALADTAGAPVVTCGRIVVDAQVSTIWAEGYRAKEVTVDRPHINVVIEKRDGAREMNIDELLDLHQVAAWIEKLPRVTVETIAVNDGSIDYSDLSLDEPVRQKVQSLSFAMSDFDTNAGHENAQQFASTVGEHGKVNWTGQFSLKPLAATGELEVTDLDLARYTPYYRGAIEVRVLDGELSAKVRYDLAPLADEPVIRATVDHAAIRGVAAKGQGTLSWLVAADEVATGRIVADLMKASIEMDSVLIDGGVATVLAERVTLAMPEQTEGDDDAGEVEKVEVTIEPVAATEPVDMEGEAEPEPPVAVADDAQAEPATGPVHDGKLVITDLLKSAWRLTLHQFDARDQTVLLIETLPDEPVRRAMVSELPADDATLRVIALDRIGLAELNVTTAPLGATATKLEIENPALAFDVDAERRAFLPAIRQIETKSTATLPALPSVTLDQIVLSGAAIHFTDASTEQPAELVIENAGGTIGPIFTQGDQRIALDLSAVVGSNASAKVVGQVNPFPATRYADVAVTLEPYGLEPLDGYFRRYLGYDLDEGAAKLELVYTIDGTALTGKNSIELHKFYLGEKAESEEALDLPIKLGLGLLRDTDGNVMLDVPIEGDLDDPKLRIGGLVVQAIVNTFTRITTAPFSFLGSAFGAGEEDISFVAFEPGVATWTGSEAIKLDTLSKALTERPSLRLTIRSTTSDDDAAVLRKAALMQQIKEETALTLPEGDPLRADPSRIVIDDAAYRAAVMRRYAATSPMAAAPAADAAEVETPVEEAPTRVVRRGGRGSVGGAQRTVEVEPETQPDEVVATDADMEAAPPVPFEEAEAAVLAQVTVDDAALLALAKQRGEAVVTRLTQDGTIDATRLMLAEETSDEEPPQPGPIAWFALE